MAIKNFSDLLSRALAGETSALMQWHQYQTAGLFEKSEIEIALSAINNILSKENSLQQGNALFLRGYMHQIGQGEEVDHTKAIELYEKAIQLGNIFAMTKRAFMHEKGIGGEVNYTKAIELYEKAIQLGNALAMNNRAFMHEEGRGGEVDYTKAIELYEKAIQLGHAAAMNNRAFMHEKGRGGEVDYTKAIELYEKAILLGNDVAMNNRAFMHEHGRGGVVNYTKAIEFYEKAIQLGNAVAMNNRALMHEHGIDGEVNYNAAIELYEKAIQLGDAVAMKVDLEALRINASREKEPSNFFQEPVQKQKTTQKQETPQQEQGSSQVDKLLQIAKDYHDHFDAKTKEQAEAMKPEDYNDTLDLGVRKCYQVKQLMRILNNTSKPQEKLSEFKTALSKVRPLLEQHRDNAAIRFLKYVAVILSLNLASTFGIWHVRGKKAAQEMDDPSEQSSVDDTKPKMNS